MLPYSCCEVALESVFTDVLMQKLNSTGFCNRGFFVVGLTNTHQEKSMTPASDRGIRVKSLQTRK